MTHGNSFVRFIMIQACARRYSQFTSCAEAAGLRASGSGSSTNKFLARHRPYRVL